MHSRRFSLALAFTVVSAAVLLCWLTSLPRSGAAAPAPADGADFKGKFLAINVESPKSQYNAALSDVRIRRLAERGFLVGKGIDDDQVSGWCKGKTLWIPLEHISLIVEFEDKEALKKEIQERAQDVPPAPPPQVK